MIRIDWIDRLLKIYCHLSGRNTLYILLPSRGGKGKRLKSPRPIFIVTIDNNVIVSRSKLSVAFSSLSKIPATKAMRKLERGPDKATRRLSVLGFFKLYGLTGTGLPHPKFVKSIIRKPKTSKCAIGLSVSRPLYFAVGSPLRFATNAWAYSWTVTLSITTRKIISASVKPIVGILNNISKT